MKENTELFLLAMEECAEVQQCLSKVLRFGIDNSYNGVTNKEHLETEFGDLLFLFTLMKERGIIDSEAVEAASKAKGEKLKRWSTLFNN
jgi:NTP pyrophosphatase (non-canonical NTP hydrolase)